MLIDMHEGARLGEHRTDSRISIQVLAGKVSVTLPAGSYEVAAGQLLAVTGCMKQEIEAALGSRAAHHGPASRSTGGMP